MANDSSIRLRLTVPPGSMLHDDLLMQREGGCSARLLSLAHMGLAFLRMNSSLPAANPAALPVAAATTPREAHQPSLLETPQRPQPHMPVEAAIPDDFNPLAGANLDALSSYDGS